jgi:rhamnose transport system ATP-binding protein
VPISTRAWLPGVSEPAFFPLQFGVPLDLLMTDPLLRLSQIRKGFGGVLALRGVELEVRAGEVLGLIGENGAGKSTLVNIATGVFSPDSGEILLEGKKLRLSNPRQASAAGIAVVHQEADLFAELSIAENMLLARGLVRGSTGLISWQETYWKASQEIAAMGESFDVRQKAGDLPIARRMVAEIAAAVSEKARVLFLDEPTSSLTLNEIESLFRQICRLRDSGVGIVYVSHRLEEILQICDRVTVLRDGETVETLPVAGLTMDRMVSSIIGRELSEVFCKREVPIGEVRLQVVGASSDEGVFREVSFEIRGGEIVGLYGFVGAGRSELAQALFGLHPLAVGEVMIDGRTVRIQSPGEAVKAGLAYLPEDRLVQGVFRGHSVQTNASVTVLPSLSRWGWISEGKEKAMTAEIMESMQVRAASAEQLIGTLSGGNQQKVVFGRWRATHPKVFLLDEPTRGVDVGARAEIHRLICDLAESGVGILLISSDLPEVLAMSDRVITLSEGGQTGTFNPRIDPQETVAAAAVPRVSSGETAGSPKVSGRTSPWFHLREISLVGFILVLCVIAAFVKPREFATLTNFYDVLASTALPAIMAQGAMLVISAGGIDISVGSMMGLTGALAAMAANAGLPPLLCLLLALGLGACCSLINGGISLLARIHPIIVTLAGISIYRGFMQVVTGGREVEQLPASYRALADGNLFGIPKIIFYLLLITILAHLFMRYTLSGRKVLALGNSESASRLLGLSKNRLTLLVFALSGILTGLTSVLHAAYYGKIQANTGEGMELRAIAAAVIGGTSISGGRGSALGVLPGAFLVSLLYNILILAGASSYWQNIFVGALILVAMIVDVIFDKLKRARK